MENLKTYQIAKDSAILLKKLKAEIIMPYEIVNKTSINNYSKWICPNAMVLRTVSKSVIKENHWKSIVIHKKIIRNSIGLTFELVEIRFLRLPLLLMKSKSCLQKIHFDCCVRFRQKFQNQELFWIFCCYKAHSTLNNDQPSLLDLMNWYCTLNAKWNN